MAPSQALAHRRNYSGGDAQNTLISTILREKERPINKRVTLQRLVDKTFGFSGADLKVLVETAVDYAIDDSDGGDEITSVSNQHLSEALREISPSIGEWLGLAKSFVEYGNQDGQYDELKKFLKRYG